MKLSDLEKHSPADWLSDLRDQLKRHIYERSLLASRDADPLIHVQTVGTAGRG